LPLAGLREASLHGSVAPVGVAAYVKEVEAEDAGSVGARDGRHETVDLIGEVLVDVLGRREHRGVELIDEQLRNGG